MLASCFRSCFNVKCRKDISYTDIFQQMEAVAEGLILSDSFGLEFGGSSSLLDSHILLAIATSQKSCMLQTSNSSKKTHGAADPRTRITWASFLGSEEPSLKFLRLAKLQCTNSSPISNCRHSKWAILFRTIKIII